MSIISSVLQKKIIIPIVSVAVTVAIITSLVIYILIFTRLLVMGKQVLFLFLTQLQHILLLVL